MPPSLEEKNNRHEKKLDKKEKQNYNSRIRKEGAVIKSNSNKSDKVISAPYSRPGKPEYGNVLEFEVSGKYALFSDPIMRAGGEKFSYQIPTHEVLKHVMESVYWKPTIMWRILECRVCAPIQTETKSIKLVKWEGTDSDLAYYTYLKDVRYQVRAEFLFNRNYPDMKADRNVQKHFDIAKRSIEYGGRFDTYLGTRECQADVRPCTFGEGEGAYDNIPELSFGLMFHGFTYPNEAYNEETAGMLTGNFWRATMKNGIIHFPESEECIHKPIRPYPFTSFRNKITEGSI